VLLTAHVVTSVGWIGAVTAFLSLAVVGFATPAAYVAMNTIGIAVIVPAALLALTTGIVQSLVTPWGLVRHRWVLTKLVLGVLATILLVLHQFTAVTEAARRASLGLPVGSLRTQLVVDASLAIGVLVVATVLSVFKPWGLTRFGQRERGPSSPLPTSAKLGLVLVGLVLAAVAGMHLSGHGFHHGH
jgi:hypothetical protein